MLGDSARRTFEFRTIDDLLDLATDLLPHANDFRARYLEVSGTNTSDVEGVLVVTPLL